MEDLSYMTTEYGRRKGLECYDIESVGKESRACKTCIHRLNNHDEEPCLSCHEESEWTQDQERLINPRTDERAKPESVQSGRGESTDGGNISEDDWRQEI